MDRDLLVRAGRDAFERGAQRLDLGRVVSSVALIRMQSASAGYQRPRSTPPRIFSARSASSTRAAVVSAGTRTANSLKNGAANARENPSTAATRCGERRAALEVERRGIAPNPVAPSAAR